MTISASYRGATRTAALTVKPPGVAALSLGPPTLAGGATAHGTVTLTGAAPAAGTVVKLKSSRPDLVPTPTQVTVPGAATSVGFDVATDHPSTATMVTVTASSGGTSKTAKVTVTR